MKLGKFPWFLLAVGFLFACGAPSPPEPFSFIAIDDVHYAHEDDYDWDVIDTFDQVKADRVRRTTRISMETFIPFMQELKSQAETALPRPAAIFNAGDLVHGAVAVKPDAHFQSFFRAYRSVDMPIPLFNANGNHEMAEAGMQEAYDRYFLPFHSEQAGREITTRHFSVDIGNSHFILIDGLPPDGAWGDHEKRIWNLGDVQWRWLEADLAENRDKDHIFMFSHAPIWPLNTGDVMYLHTPEKHQAFIDLLLRYNVRIFFSGHIHQNSVVVYEADGRQLVQMIPNANLTRLDVPAPTEPPVREYSLATTVDTGAPNVWTSGLRTIVERDQNRIVYFEKSSRSLAGYFLVSVEGPKVTVRMYRGIGRKLHREYTIIRDPETGATRFQ